VAYQTFLFLVNPRSGTKLGQGAEQMAGLLDQKTVEAGHKAQCVVTQAKGHATELAREAAQSGEWDAIVAVGGDGTVNEVAHALAHTNTPLGILPMGSGNGLARHLGIPLTLNPALKHLFASQVSVIDSATLNDRPFFCVAGLGFDAYVGHLFGQQSRRGWNTYLRVSLKAYWDYAPLRLKINGQEQEVFSLSFANAGQFGNNAWVAPHADLTDGLLELCTVTPFPRWYGTTLTYQLFTKGLGASTYVAYESLPEVTVETEAPALVHYDGEPWQLDTTRIEVRIVPQNLLVKA
jgi:diacylglycerol kinase (ATP)